VSATSRVLVRTSRHLRLLTGPLRSTPPQPPPAPLRSFSCFVSFRPPQCNPVLNWPLVLQLAAGTGLQYAFSVVFCFPRAGLMTIHSCNLDYLCGAPFQLRLQCAASRSILPDMLDSLPARSFVPLNLHTSPLPKARRYALTESFCVITSLSSGHLITVAGT
jgi:hypothetical protein